jgi:hypothetical protein
MFSAFWARLAGRRAVPLALATLALLASHDAKADLELPDIKLYGFARLDVIYSDSKLNHPQSTQWVLSEDASTGNEDDSQLLLYPRLSRLGIKLLPYDLTEGFSVLGVLEIDFQNGGSESRAGLRMRHAYGVLRWQMLELLFGQTWDLISPLMPTVNSDTLMWNTGNLGDRRPQIVFSVKPKVGDGHFRTAVSVNLPNAVDGKDLDDNGETDGFDAAVPMVEGLVELSMPVWTQRPLLVAGHGHWAREEVATAVGGQTEFDSWSAGASLSLPIIDPLWIQGEFFYGENLSDLRGGIGQGVNTTNGREVRSLGGWGEIVWLPVQWVTLSAGGSVDDPDDADVDSGGRVKNWAAWGAVKWRPWKPFQVGVEYIHWVTSYKDLDDGVANRFNIHTSLFF